MPRLARLFAILFTLALLAGCGAKQPQGPQPEVPIGPFTLTVPLQGKPLVPKHVSCPEAPGPNPPVAWSNPPAGTKSFVIRATSMDPYRLYWYVVNIPASVRSLAEGLGEAALMEDGSLQLRPWSLCPAEAPAKTVRIAIYALSVPELDPVAEDVTLAMQRHTIDFTDIVLPVKQ